MLTFLGDVALISDDVKSEYKPCGEYIFNCEYVICDNKQNKPVTGKINLSSLKCDFDEIFGKIPVAVTLSNNHIFDYGQEGYSETKKRLKLKGIECIEKRPWKFGNIYVLSFMNLKSSNPLDDSIQFNKTQVVDEVNKLKKDPKAKIIVSVHWGIENDPNETQEQKTLAHWLIDLGVDLIIGHHPHCVQPIEEYKGKYIFYSLGNGLFPPINQDSHYDKYGVSTRKYRFKWKRWNRESLAVTVDDMANIINVESLYQIKGVLHKKGNHVVEALVGKRKASRIVYYFRKYWLFLASNTFVDGKLIDIAAVKSELKK